MRLARVLYITLLTLVFIVPSSGAADKQSSSQKEGSGMAKIVITSNAFLEGETIPKKFTCDGEDISPQLSWSGIPDGAKELVLVCEDPDAPSSNWIHWVLYGLSPDKSGLAENVAKKETAAGAKQGKNDFGKIGYGGPCPPRGPAHRYFFRLYAIDVNLSLKPGATKKELTKGIDGHIVAHGELMGKYAR